MPTETLLNQGMNANCASYPGVGLGLGFKNPTREDSYLKSATPSFGLGEWINCQDILTKFGLKLVKLGIFPKLRIFAGGVRDWKLGRIRDWGNFTNFFLKLLNFGC
ncbi:MAG: hypothetical protein PX637_15640, partial [Microcystis sp. M53601_WE4]|nr:hypothetical protein [Microcystis sp. M53601_WE4]